MKKIVVAVLVLATGFGMMGCEKESSNLVMPKRPNVGAGSEGDDNYDYFRYSSEGRLRDSVYLYTYYFYLWQDQLPGSFATHNYRTADGVLNALKGFARDGSGNQLDRFSFLDREGTVSQELQEGYIGSFGFDIRFRDTDSVLYVSKVDFGSPAYLAGMKRGMRLTEINGRQNLSYKALEADDFNFLFDAIYARNIQMKMRNPEGQELSVSLQASIYGYRPIIASRIFDLGAKKVGYFALDAFVSNQLIQSELDAMMNAFQAAGAKEVIVDLRYNGGGDVATANYISNLLAPSSAKDKLMNYYIINNTLRSEGWEMFLFYPAYYYQVNALELDRIYFLVTNGTASASELLINNLKPYIDVKLIGKNRTYGKPVGYFGWDIMGVDLYAVSFQTMNANNEGDYFDGMPVDKSVLDDLSRDFGDPQEWMTAEALYHAQHGYFTTGPGLNQSLGRIQSVSTAGDLNRQLNQRSRKDMFDFRKMEIK